MEKQGKHGGWKKKWEKDAVRIPLLRYFMPFHILFLFCVVRFGFVCPSAAYILVLICVIEWLVLISIFFSPTPVFPAG